MGSSIYCLPVGLFTPLQGYTGMSESKQPPTLDPAASDRWTSLNMMQSPWLHEEIASRMLERLEFIRLQPSAWWHWEALRGGILAHRALRNRYGKAHTWVSSECSLHQEKMLGILNPPWWRARRWLDAPVHLGRPGDAMMQMVWANMALHASARPQALLDQWYRALATEGFLMFSCFGPDTLKELRGLYSRHGWGEPCHAFTDMHDWGDMLVESGFAEPVMDMERITLTFETPARLLAELRGLGRNLHRDRFQGLRGRQWHQKLQESLLDLARSDQQGRLALTFEVVYGHAIKPVPRSRLKSETAIPVDDMRRMLRSSDPPGRKV
jgi:malonyl-CoA O-methyltransferase